MFSSQNLLGFQIFSKTKEEVKMNIAISEKNLRELCNILNKLLSNEYLLYTKTLKFHWNVVGDFYSMHAFFKDLYEKTFTISDDVAERARALGGNSFGTMTEFLKSSVLKEHPGVYPDQKGMIKELLDDHETIIRQLRDDIETALKLGDSGTNTFLADLIVKHEKMAWMLRANFAK
jgi:starvation-inducible DNA-binding protein